MRAGASRGVGYRLAVTARVGLAAFGGYAVAALSVALLALVLPLSRADATTIGTLLSFAILAAAIVWVFAARTLGRAALVLGSLAALLAAALWLAGAFTQAGAA